MSKQGSTGNTLYWRCQIAGWALFFIGLQFEFALYNRYFQRPLIWAFLSKGFIFVLLGLLVSHFLRRGFHWLKLFDKKFKLQIFYLVLFLIIATISFTGLAYLIDKVTHSRLLERYGGPFTFSVYRTAFPFTIWILLYYTVGYVRRLEESRKSGLALEYQYFELEARALRAQMNPHFMFNCLNSIKALIQENKNEQAAIYLATFSRLIRTLINNAEKKEIPLDEEIKTCQLYLELEVMRFDGKMTFVIQLDKEIDLRTIRIPALTIQPFIENAVWHGIVPKYKGGTVSLFVKKRGEYVDITIDDDGIGREASRRGKSSLNIGHQSKGVAMTQSRFDLDNFLLHREAKLAIEDKYESDGKAKGTRVIITLKAFG